VKLAQAQQGQFSRRRALGLTVGAVLILALMAIFGWKLLEEFKVTYPNGPDLGTKIAPTYRLAGVPETFFINKNGQVADLEIGPLTETRLVSAIEKLLKE